MPLEIIPGESRYEPDAVKRKVSTCCEGIVHVHGDALVCTDCRRELTEADLIDEE